MAFAIPIFFLYKRRFLFPYIILVNAYLLSNIWYYRNYGTLMPVTSYTMVDNLEGLGPSVWNSIQWVDLWIVFPSIAFLAYYNKFMKLFPAGDCRTDLKLLAGSVLLIFMIEAPSYILHKPTEYAHPYGLYRNEIIRAYRQFGFINYWISLLSH